MEKITAAVDTPLHRFMYFCNVGETAPHAHRLYNWMNDKCPDTCSWLTRLFLGAVLTLAVLTFAGFVGASMGTFYYHAAIHAIERGTIAGAGALMAERGLYQELTFFFGAVVNFSVALLLIAVIFFGAIKIISDIAGRLISRHRESRPHREHLPGPMFHALRASLEKVCRQFNYERP